MLTLIILVIFFGMIIATLYMATKERDVKDESSK